jgi:hypothetical protein
MKVAFYCHPSIVLLVVVVLRSRLFFVWLAQANPSGNAFSSSWQLVPKPRTKDDDEDDWRMARRRGGIPSAIGVTQLPPALRVGRAEAGNPAKGREDVGKGLTVLRRPNYPKNRPHSDPPKRH